MNAGTTVSRTLPSKAIGARVSGGVFPKKWRRGITPRVRGCLCVLAGIRVVSNNLVWSADGCGCSTSRSTQRRLSGCLRSGQGRVWMSSYAAVKSRPIRSGAGSEPYWVWFRFFCEDGALPSKCPIEFRQRAVRLLQEIVPQSESEYAAIRHVASRLGISTHCVVGTWPSWSMPVNVWGRRKVSGRRSADSSGRTRSCAGPTRSSRPRRRFSQRSSTGPRRGQQWVRAKECCRHRCQHGYHALRVLLSHGQAVPGQDQRRFPSGASRLGDLQQIVDEVLTKGASVHFVKEGQPHTRIQRLPQSVAAASSGRVRRVRT